MALNSSARVESLTKPESYARSRSGYGFERWAARPIPRRAGMTSVPGLGDAFCGSRATSTLRRKAFTRGPLRRPPEAAGLLGSPATIAVWSGRSSWRLPRGYCAGVERAVETVEKALDLYGAPVYVRKQIVHNLHVVRDLEARGAIFVDEETEVPEGETVVFSAHGVAPSVRANAGARRLTTIDATCPLVTKVHVQARRYAASGYTVLLIGHAGHEEVVGTMGEAPEAIVLVESVDDAEALAFAPGTPARLHHADDALGRRDRARSSPRSGGAFPTSTRPSAKTSVTQPRTGSGRSRRCCRRSTCCS